MKMTLKVGQWVKYTHYKRTETGIEAGHCYYKIKAIQPARRTFTVAYPWTAKFSLDTGAVVHRGQLYPEAGAITALSAQDEAFLLPILEKERACLMIFSNGEAIACG
jgi:hypothetical protein